MNPTNRTTRVILMRHGRSTFNQQQRYQGSSDASELTEQGCETACQVGQWLQDLEIDAIYVSPLRRAKQTLEQIQPYLDHRIPVYVRPQLREIELPDWEGLPYEQVKTEFTELYQTWKQQPHKFKMGHRYASEYELEKHYGNTAVLAAPAPTATQTECFPVLDLYLRAEQFWQDVLPHRPGQTILVISHGGTNHALISTALGLSPAHHHSLQQSNCGISILNVAADLQTAQLEVLNLTTPLGETLPKLKEGKQGLRLLLVPSDTNATDAAKLAEFLKSVPIEFSLASDLDHPTVDRLLVHHPRAVNLQVCREQFLQDWLGTLRWKPITISDLTTGLVVAPPASLQLLLAEATGLPLNQHRWFQLQPGCLSVLHYPSANQRPVVQAINLSTAGAAGLAAATQTSVTLGGRVNG
ncbi:MAG: histidine phosphatase family protein [Elainella sp. C42_A2020_010]|nr:histidine phosphatase family protein [Elainella sp. C42_A2020_010]